MPPLRQPLLLSLALLAAAGCLDFAPDGKVFACPGCDADAGLDAGAPDAGSGCSCQAPDPTCRGSGRVSASSTQCVLDGGCEASLIETPRGQGCDAGSCIGEPCLGVVCTLPPRSSCVDPTTLRLFTPVGACQAGGCVYSSAKRRTAVE